VLRDIFVVQWTNASSGRWVGEIPTLVLDGNEKDDLQVAVKSALKVSADQWLGLNIAWKLCGIGAAFVSELLTNRGDIL
jgi:hypothetical protein